MSLLCIGFNWKTPVALRERLTIEGDKLFTALDRLRAVHPADEFAILSTCNRTEVYAASQRAEGTVAAGVLPPPDTDDLCRFLADFHGLPLTDFYEHLYFHADASVAEHLFQVASGLDSLVLGEAQILGQAKQAYQCAVDHGTAGPVLHTLFQRAFAAAKRVQTETTLSRGKLSIASAAVEYVRGVYDRFDDKTVLVLGAGKMAELTLRHLAELKPGRLMVCNRSLPRAEALAARFAAGGGPTVSVHDLTKLHDVLCQADIVVSSTGAEETLVGVDAFRKIMEARRQRWIAIVDIAVPRDFAKEIGNLENVWLWNIDDLEKVRHRTLRAREKDLDQALKIID
ncbi:MAG: glutamyl-tRNA reductase, partial [Planctomycetia bacterium]